MKFVSGKEDNMSHGKGAKPRKNLFMGSEQVSLKESAGRKEQNAFGLEGVEPV